MGCSFIAMLTAFCVEEGKNLPGLSALPGLTYWFLPTLVGALLIILAPVPHRMKLSTCCGGVRKPVYSLVMRWMARKEDRTMATDEEDL